MRVFGYTGHEGRQLVVALSAAVLLLSLPVQSAWAYGYTAVAPPPGVEASHEEIMVAIYGGNWVADVNGVDFSNDAGITAKRVYDFNGPDEIVHVLNGNQDDVDQTWTDGTVTVSAQVKWADHDQSFGWNGGGLGTSYNVLLTDADLNGDSVPIEITGDFLWGTEPTHDAITEHWWSDPDLNSDGYDHMVSYFIEGLADADGATVWLLLWEDLPCQGDVDFNDFGIEVRAVPEPGTLLLVGAGLAALGAFRSRRPRA